MYQRVGARKERRSGAIVVLVAVSFTAILYLTALAVDMGSLMAARRQAQNCCDAAALAACLNLVNGGSSTTITSAANLSLTKNGYTNGSSGVTVTVINPIPTTATWVNSQFQNSNSVAVELTFTRSNMVVTGSNTVTVYSVASSLGSSAPSDPMLILDPSGADAFWINGGNLTLNTAPVQVNSTNVAAAVVQGTSTTGTASIANAHVQIAGGTTGTTGSFSPAAVTGGSPLANPYALLPVPSIPSTTYTTSVYNPNSSGNITLNPGYYPNGLYVINGGNVTMNPGLYYVSNGNLWINTTGTVTASGVTLYHSGPNSTATLYQDYGLTVGICLCPTDSNYTFTPPTTGTYAGVSFFHGPNNTAEAFYDFWGTGVLTAGIQYFPSSTLRCWAVSDGLINCNELVAKDFKLTGSHEIYGTSENNGYSKLNWTASRATNRPNTSVYLAQGYER